MELEEREFELIANPTLIEPCREKCFFTAAGHACVISIMHRKH